MRKEYIKDAVIVEWETNHFYFGFQMGQFAYKIIREDETESDYLEGILSIIEKQVYKHDTLTIRIHYIIDSKLYTSVHIFE